MGRKADQDGGGRAGGEARHIHLPARLDAELERHHRIQNVRLGVCRGANRMADYPIRYIYYCNQICILFPKTWYLYVDAIFLGMCM